MDTTHTHRHRHTDTHTHTHTHTHTQKKKNQDFDLKSQLMILLEDIKKVVNKPLKEIQGNTSKQVEAL